MTTTRGGAPRQDHVPASLGVCPKHGEVEFRTHKVGFDREGRQRFRRRCPICHAERNTEANHANTPPSAT